MIEDNSSTKKQEAKIRHHRLSCGLDCLKRRFFNPALLFNEVDKLVMRQL